MEILLDIGGAICRIPASGEIVTFAYTAADSASTDGWVDSEVTPASIFYSYPVRFAGISDLSLDALLDMRDQLVLSMIPFPPGSITVADLCERSGMKRNAVRSLLREFERDGRIESRRPSVHLSPGNVARLYWRVG